MDAFGQISNPFVDPGPVAGGGSSLCPEGFEEFSGICYHFGSHASYVSASAKCQEYSAELVRVNDRNLGLFDFVYRICRISQEVLDQDGNYFVFLVNLVQM